MIDEVVTAMPWNGNSTPSTTDSMRIAWRYNDLRKIDSEQGGNNRTDKAYIFDLLQFIESDEILKLDVTTFDGTDNQNKLYKTLIDQLYLKTRNQRFECSSDASDKNVLRISIESLGSPLWWNENFTSDLCRFLVILKAIVRHSHAVCCITMPTHLFKYTVSDQSIAVKQYIVQVMAKKCILSYGLF